MRRGFRLVARGLDALERGTGIAAGFSVLAMTLLGTADVLGRTFWQHPLLGQVEISRVLVVYAAFLGLAAAEARDTHVRLRVLDPLIPPRARRGRAALVGALAVTAAAAVTAATAVSVWRAWLDDEALIAPIPLPAWIAKLGLALGFLLFTARLAVDEIARRWDFETRKAPPRSAGWSP